MFHVTELYHLNVVCSDFEKSLDFYVDKLGGIPAYGYGKGKDRDRQTAVAMRRPLNVDSAKKKGMEPSQSIWALIRFGDYETATYIDLIHRITPKSVNNGVGPNQIGVSRICFGVNDLDAAYKDLTEKGVEFYSPPGNSLLEDGEPLIYSANCKDPDGVCITFIQAPLPRWGNPPAENL